MKTPITLLLLAVALGPLGGNASQVSKTEEPTISINISTPQNTVRVGSEIIVDVVTQNISHHVIHYTVIAGAGAELSHFRVDVRNSVGKPVTETQYGQKVHGTDHRAHSGSVFGADIPVEPGKTLHEKLILTKEYDLSQPGTYTVQLRRTDFDDSSVKSNTITLTITP